MYRVTLGLYFSKHTCWVWAWGCRDGEQGHLQVCSQPAAPWVLVRNRQLLRKSEKLRRDSAHCLLTPSVRSCLPRASLGRLII